MLWLSALALLLLLLAAGRRVRWPAAPPASHPAAALPAVAVLAPMAGEILGLDAFLAALQAQSYPHLRLILIIEAAREAEGDPLEAAVQIAARERAGLPPGTTVVRAARATSSSQKAANLIAGLGAIGNVEIVALVDADALPHRNWLRDLVRPLIDETRAAVPTVTTGYHWYLPGRGLAALLRSAFLAAALGVMADPERAFASGGTLALWRTDLERLGIPGAWRTALSDDMAVTRAVRRAGGSVRFVPECVLPSFDSIGWRGLGEFTVRQVVMLRWGDRRLWVALLLYHLALAATQIGAILTACGMGSLPGGVAGRLFVLALLAAPTILGMVRARGRFQELETRPLARVPGWDRRRGAHIALAPVVTWLMLGSLIGAAWKREISWCGIRYRLAADGAVQVVSGPDTGENLLRHSRRRGIAGR